MAVLRSVIRGVGAHLPKRIVTNDDLAKIVDTSDSWIQERSGIVCRHIADENELTSDLGAAAAKQALVRAGIDPVDIDLIVCATATPDRTFPATAVRIQSMLGVTKGAAFDVQAVCSGFVYAMTVADNFLKLGQSKRALVIGAETFSRILDWTDRSTCVLFGDGAGAVVLEASDEPGIIATKQHADGAYKHLLYNPVGVSAGFQLDEPNAGVRVLMTGNEVFKVAVKTLDRIVEETLEAAGMHESDIDWLIPHQANLRIIEATAKRLKLSMERVIVTVDRHGNTSSGSVPLALDEAVRSGKVKRGQTLLLEAFGGGFTWSSALLKY